MKVSAYFYGFAKIRAYFSTSFWFIFLVFVANSLKMSKAFLSLPRYRLNGSQYSWMVNKLSDLLSTVPRNGQKLRERYVSLFHDDLSIPSDPFRLILRIICSDSVSYPPPTKGEHELIVSYGNVIVKTKGKYSA